MRRLFFVGGGVVLAAAIAAAVAFSTVTPTSIEDSFRGTTIDPEVWAFWGTGQPEHVTIGQRGGSLTVRVAGSAPPDFNAGGETRCRVHGDFNAKVDITLVDWPAQNGVWAAMMIAGTPYNVYRVSWQFEHSEAYGAYLPPAGNTLPATGTTLKLRLTRRGDVISAYYRSGTHWIPLVSGIGPTGDVPLSLNVFNISNAATFAGQPVTVSFDHFQVDADAVVCP